MNNLLRVSLADEVQLALESMGQESYAFKIEQEVAELNRCHQRLRELDAPGNGIALEAVEGEKTTLLDRIKAIIKKIVDFAVSLFGKIKDYVLHLVDATSQNTKLLAQTQAMINAAKAKVSRPKTSVATEGYSTGTIPVQAPKFLHIDYSKISSETQRLEYLADNYIKDAAQMLNLQLRHCKFIIEAYNRLMNSPDADLGEFDRTCQDVVKECERRMQGFRASSRVFDCIEIVEDVKDNPHAGVLKYRVSIKPPTPEDMAFEPASYTTNLTRAQDLQDKLVSLNAEIVKCATHMKEFFSQNSKNFLSTLNSLNDSAARTGKFDAHSDYIVQVHNFLVRGNLIQVVTGLNVLNTVWKAVNQLNTRVVKEFLSS